MNLKQTIRNYIKTKIFDPSDAIGDLNDIVGWHSIGGSGAYGFYKDHQYENGYSSISKLGNGFAAIEPYTIDKTGESVASNILDRIYTANTDMSAYDFREALAVTTLVHDKVRLQVHHSGTRVNANSITGFTFLENFTESISEGRRYYRLPNGTTLNDDDVITLKSVNPDNLNSGFSPSRAARRWTRLDDYIADYQKGFFENGAVPAGQMIITAKTSTEFNDIVDMIQAKHKGAGKNNNITYTHRPLDQNGSPLNSQIEWVPFSSPNKDMGLKELFTQVNQKIDSSFGVPAEIRGLLSNSNYASVAVAEKVFVKYALAPMTLKIWSKFTHELNRITGGTGVAISYDLDIPQIADEEKIKAEAKSVDAGTVTSLVTQGFELKSAIEYVRSGNLEALELGRVPPKDKPEVLTPEEARGTPSQPIDMFAKSLETLKEHIDVGFSQLKLVGKENGPELVVKQIDVIDRELYIQKMSRIIRDQMNRQVTRAIDKLDEAIKSKAYGDTTESEDEEFTAEMLAVLLPLMSIYGNKQVNTGINLVLQAGLTTENIKPFEFTPQQRKEYQRYLAKVGTGYAEQTAEQIRQILGQGILDGLPKQAIENQLRAVILGPENQYRVARLSRTEVNLSEGRASVDAMENIAEQTGYKIYKVWNISSSDPCEFCLALAGERVLVDEYFVDLGDDIHGIDGGVYKNDFTPTDTADAHPNCNCYPTYEVERG